MGLATKTGHRGKLLTALGILLLIATLWGITSGYIV